MKKIISLIMALALMLSMSLSVYATEPAGNGSITITNPTIGATYNLYKIFDASPALNSDNTPILVDGKPLISYTMDANDQFFKAMFGSVDNPENPYFTYTAIEGENKGNIARKEGVTKETIQAYLKELIENAKKSGNPYDTINEEPVVAADDSVSFTGLAYGYYLIDSSLGALVTLTSTTPSVNVIDKNQIPGTKFDKKVWDEDAGQWVEDTSASVGDILKFKIDFEATNYHGDYPVKYYTVKDTKGSALWVEFNRITVKISTGLADDPSTTNVDESFKILDKGYYHFASTVIEQTNEWTLFGDGWSAAQKADAAANGHEKYADEAQWYLIHRGYDEFDIVIPWMTQHDFTGTSNGFTLTYPEADTVTTPVTSRYDSPVTVVIEYTASVEPSATIGQNQSNNLWNRAQLTWTSVDTTGPKDPETTDTRVYALGLLKTDSDTGAHLEGAVFELYREAIDENNKSVIGEPVYVIPTGIAGVYIVDDLNTEVSGRKRESARIEYAQYLEEYLGADFATTQKNVVTTEVNGKVIVKGLEAGNYYLKEIDAPDGYNLLPEAKLVTVGATNESFFVIADAQGNVFDEESASDGHINHSYTATSVTVPNSKGVELPSTGGQGKFMLITMGTMVAIAFATFLITHKKMSVYED